MIIGSINTTKGMFLLGYSDNIENLFSIIENKYGPEAVNKVKEFKDAYFKASEVTKENARTIVEHQKMKYNSFISLTYLKYNYLGDNEDLKWLLDPVESFHSLLNFHNIDINNLFIIKWK